MYTKLKFDDDTTPRQPHYSVPSSPPGELKTSHYDLDGKLTDDQTHEDLREVFSLVDLDDEGDTISMHDLVAGMRTLGHDSIADEWQEMIDDTDAALAGELSFPHVLAWIRNRKNRMDAERDISTAFSAFDRDDDDDRMSSPRVSEQGDLVDVPPAGSNLQSVEEYRLQWHAFDDRRCGWTLQRARFQFLNLTWGSGCTVPSWEILYIGWAPTEYGFRDDRETHQRSMGASGEMYELPPWPLPLHGWQVFDDVSEPALFFAKCSAGSADGPPPKLNILSIQ